MRFKCQHSELERCQCECHDYTESGEPKVFHILACCESCSICKRNISFGITTSDSFGGY